MGVCMGGGRQRRGIAGCVVRTRGSECEAATKARLLTQFLLSFSPWPLFISVASVQIIAPLPPSQYHTDCWLGPFCLLPLQDRPSLFLTKEGIRSH